MIVLDASAVVELLLGTELGAKVNAHLSDASLDLHAPHLLDIEVAQVLRRYVREREIASEEASGALDTLRSLDLERHEHEPFLDRVWALRDNLSAYDAIYVALAEALDCQLLTCDGRLARAPRLSKRIKLLQLQGPTRR